MSLRMAKPAPVPVTECPVCKYKVDCASAINEPGIFRHPDEGDVTVCIECMAWLVFRDDLSLRLMTKKEIDHLREEERTPLVELTQSIRKVHELQAHRTKVR